MAPLQKHVPRAGLRNRRRASAGRRASGDAAVKAEPLQSKTLKMQREQTLLWVLTTSSVPHTHHPHNNAIDLMLPVRKVRP